MDFLPPPAPGTRAVPPLPPGTPEASVGKGLANFHWNPIGIYSPTPVTGPTVYRPGAPISVPPVCPPTPGSPPPPTCPPGP